MMDDEAPDWMAQFDQTLASMGEWTRLMRAHYDGAVNVGFTEAQAMDLTLGYQHALVLAANQ